MKTYQSAIGKARCTDIYTKTLIPQAGWLNTGICLKTVSVFQRGEAGYFFESGPESPGVIISYRIHHFIDMIT
jgi:hypothetical protein